MYGLPCALLAILLALALVTLVGHGIWVLLATIFGGGKKRLSESCAFCGRSTPVGSERCEWCGRDLAGLLGRELRDLESCRRQLQRLGKKRVLEPEILERLRGELDAYRQELLSPARKPIIQPVAAVIVEDGAVPPGETRPRVAQPGEGRKAEKPVPLVAPISAAAAVAPQPVPPVAPITPITSDTVVPVAAAVAASRSAGAPSRLNDGAAGEKLATPSAAAPPAPRSPLPAPPPSRPWSETLAAFMEKQNIRWGELIGGLLFVCSSVALVVSLWKNIEQIPYSRFFIFVSISSAVFGVGLYAHHRWKLESTSRALLVIATLLVPLNFVAMAVMAQMEHPLLTMGSEVISLAIFAWLVGLALKVLVPDGRWLTVAAVLGNSVAVLAIARWVRSDSPGWLMVGAGAASVALFAVAVGAYLHSRMAVAGRSVRAQFTEPQIAAVFTLLGITAFATVVALGVLVAQCVKATGPQAIDFAHVKLILQRLSILLAATTVPPLATGLTVMCGSRRDKNLAAYHLAGTFVAMVATAAMLAALGAAWPSPGWLVAVAVLNAGALVFAAFRWRFPVLHGGAIACTALAYLIAFYLAIGKLPLPAADPYGAEMLRLMIGAQSGTALAGLFVVLAAVSEALARWGRRRHGVIYLRASGVVAAVGLMLVTVHGVRSGGADALRAAILYAVYGSGCLALTARWRRLGLSYLGLAMTAAAILWGMWWYEPHVGPLWGAALAIEALIMAAAAAVVQRFRSGTWHDPWTMIGEEGTLVSVPRSQGMSLADIYRIPLIHVGEAAAMLAAGLTIWSAWRDYGAILAQPSLAPLIASAAIAAVFFLLAWIYRSPQRTWVASTVVLAAAIHTLNYNFLQCVDYIGPNWTIAFLGHATIALATAWCIERFRRGDDTAWRAIGDPLANAALASSALVVPLLIFGRSAGCLWLACCLPWLAALWLVLAHRRRSVVLFAAHQTALAFAMLAAATLWLRKVAWITPIKLPTETPNLLERIISYSHVVLMPRNLEVYGLALGWFSLAWVVVRIVDLRRGIAPERLLQRRYSVDWCIRHAVVAVQWLILALGALGEVPQELLGAAAAPVRSIPLAFGATAWLALGVLAVLLLATLWERWELAEMVSLLLVATAVPCLVAGQFAPSLAVASALRWALVITFTLSSIAVWQRERLYFSISRLTGAAGQARPPSTLGQPDVLAMPAVARGVLLATMLLPVLGLTVLAAALQIGGTVPAGPLAKTFFQTLGPTWSYLVPLALAIATLVGYAVRERSTGYAFSAGLVLQLAVTLGYALHVKLANQAFDAAFYVTLLELVAVTAAAWAVVWLQARQWVDVWREQPTTGVSSGAGSRGLMVVQIGIALIAEAWVLGVALLDLGLHVMLAELPKWSVAAGRPLGWIALILPLVVLRLRGRIRPHVAGLTGMALLGLLACTIGGLHANWNLDFDPAWGYRTLMLGWAVYSLFVVAATWWIAALRTSADSAGPPQALIRMAAVWVRVAGILAIALGLQAAFLGTNEQLWAAAAIAIASGAGATMAVWRRREGWAFAAALGVNVAASLVVWHFELVGRNAFHDYWLRLVEANVIASAGVGLVWLAVRRRLYELREMTLGESPLLAVQLLLPVLGNIVLAVVPVVSLMGTPGNLPPWMQELAAPQGWIGLLVSVAAAAWYLRQTQAASLLHVLGGLALGVGVLAACGAQSLDGGRHPDAWIAYHTLTTAWAAAGLIVLGLVLAADRLRKVALAGPVSTGTRAGQPAMNLVQAWVAAIGTLTVVMVILQAFSLHDPGRPWWFAGAILTVSLTAGLVAVLLWSPASIYVSGLLINLAGTIAWWAWAPSGALWPDWHAADIAGLVQVNVLCLGIGSILWSAAEWLPRGVPIFQGERKEPFAHLAAQLGALGVGVVTIGSIGLTLLYRSPIGIQRLDWAALAGIAAASAVCLFDRRARFPLPTLYGLGLTAIGMGLLTRPLGPRMFCWSAVDVLAAYVLAAAAIAWLLPRGRGSWFPAVQAIIIAMVAAVAVWVAIDVRFDACSLGPHVPTWLAGRMASVPGLFLLLVAAMLMADIAPKISAQAAGRAGGGGWRARWQYAALTLAVLLPSGLGWALLPADVSAPWLHRSVVLMVAAGAGGLITGLGLKRFLPGGSDWRQRIDRAAPALGAATIGLLAAVLAQEAAWFVPHVGVPIAPLAIAAVIATLAGLIAGCVALAVTPRPDPLRLSGRQRQVYVYAAEVLAAAIGLHVWLTMPWLFNGFLIKYWMLIVMAVAFAGAGLAEWFQRRALPVLAEPLANTALLLPLLPAVGFWIAPEAHGPWGLVGRVPAVWFMMAAFYGVLAATRRSWWCAALSLLTGNLGLWVGLVSLHFHFQENPQVFVIPLALAGLVAEYLNHDRLSAAQSAAFRYLMLSAIYISSTADMFIAGLGNSWSLPLVLMLLSVAGMLAGIWLRVRSFLFLGLTFLVLDALSMIWYAAHDLHNTWLWYLCGIALGAAILAMFAVFEKRRGDILAAVERMQAWSK